MWQTPFEAPWDYRAHRWEVAAQQAPEGCAIKGNINRDGERIYHTPWGSQWYERTKITESKGERWFCDEAEALAAGMASAVEMKSSAASAGAKIMIWSARDKAKGPSCSRRWALAQEELVT